MRSLLLRNGDLVIGQGGFADVSGQPKVVQDLGVNVREPYGLDRFHTKYGTLLDRYVGMMVDGKSHQLIQSEISRLVQNYALIQQDQMQRDAISGFKPRYALSEIVSGISQIDIRQDMDSYAVKVTLRMADGTSFSLISSRAA